MSLAIGVFGSMSLAGAALATPIPTSDLANAASPVATSAALKVLSAEDARRYGQAFAAMNRGDLIAGQNLAKGVSDPCLLGRLEAARLLNPNYRANYPEMAAWLERNADLPEAERVYDLAMKRKPSGAAAPRAPLTASASTPSAVSLGERVSRSLQGAPAPSAGQRAARDAFYHGDLEQAYALAVRSNERWIAGLAAMRLKRYPEAQSNLEALSGDVRQSPWMRSGAAYWAARAAAAQSDGAKAQGLLKVAARSPDTFYGLIAARELQQLNAKSPKADAIADILAASTLSVDDAAAFAKSDPRAHRAAALMQIGLPLNAGEELRTAMTTASDADRPRLTSLALALNAPLGDADPSKAGWARFDVGHFPTPVLTPLGGFTIDKALVYALVRQESRFDPNAASGSGAYGLMQLTADTAARLAGDDKLRHNPAALRDPGLNLKLGQAYVTKLLAAAKGDVLKAVAGYNSGPGVVQKLSAKMGQDADSLMLVESMPSSQTRDYVQRVMSYYWTYRQIFGQDAPAIAAVAKASF
ncbi:lytic transglycosylase domain-containing protein [Caulobacter sp. S45]|uniref:lytic transglycosylase domain-containing protein n=1 Tax=Caulobacter sp. S45 TaxID=1641861 RepID=UPI00131C3A75|nr:lytic transglycosylase domain-containing protein [Caulobacter sp. S45]